MAAAAKFFQEGGIFMYPIALMSIIGIAIIIERGFFLYLRYNINGSAFMAQIQKLILANNIDRAIKLCNTAPNAALPRVLKAGLTRANKGVIEIQNAVEEETLDVLPMIQKRISGLQIIANVATLLGLLGTIFGLISAFEAVANAAPDQKQAMLASSISIAMNTTAFGLIVAIPCLLAYGVLSGLTKKIMDEIDLYSVRLINLLAARSKGGASALERQG